MSYFGATIDAVLAGKRVQAAPLVRLDFTSETSRVWPGFGDLVAGAQTWKGLGSFASIDGLEWQAGTAAVPLRLVLSGVDSGMVAKAVAAETEVKGNPCFVYLQAFNEDWSTLGNPVPLVTAVMDTMKFDATGPDQRTITLTAETMWAVRKAAPFSRYTDRDQQARFPGDRGCEFVPALVNATFKWPHYS